MRAGWGRPDLQFVHINEVAGGPPAAAHLLTFDSVHDQGRMHDPAILAIRRKIELVPSDELMAARPRRQAIVEIALRDGRRLSHRTRAVRGTADNPMTSAEVEAKALDLMAGVLGTGRAQKLVEACRTIEYIGDMCELRQYWQAATDISAGRSA